MTDAELAALTAQMNANNASGAAALPPQQFHNPDFAAYVAPDRLNQIAQEANNQNAGNIASAANVPPQGILGTIASMIGNLFGGGQDTSATTLAGPTPPPMTNDEYLDQQLAAAKKREEAAAAAAAAAAGQPQP
jgi:hypothetical protein